MEISREFYQFCKRYLQAAEKGEDTYRIFINMGLCCNISLNNLSGFSLNWYLKPKHKHPEAMSNATPFNKHYEEYCEEKLLNIVHKNPYRLAFVKDIITTYEGENHEKSI